MCHARTHTGDSASNFINCTIACGLTVKLASCADVQVFFDPTSYNVSEEMNATLTIKASTASHSFPFTITMETMDITAVAGEDYTPGGYTVSFQPGQDEATVVVPTIDDTTPELDEMYSVTITNTSEDRVLVGFPNVANVTIQDNEGVYISIKQSKVFSFYISS